MKRFTAGFRYGDGKAICVILPGTLLELWRALEICVASEKIVVCQAANTGLTGGSTPFGDDYDRDVVVINMMRIKSLHMLGDGRQIVAFPGTTLDELERALDPIGREPHSVIGSSCLGASVIGGICNNSGGSLIRRGPAYTELALYAQLGEDSTLQLVNHLDIDLGDDPLAILSALDQKSYSTKNDRPESCPLGVVISIEVSGLWSNDRLCHQKAIDAEVQPRRVGFGSLGNSVSRSPRRWPLLYDSGLFNNRKGCWRR